MKKFLFSIFTVLIFASSCYFVTKKDGPGAVKAIARNGNIFKVRMKEASMLVRKPEDVKVLLTQNEGATKLAQALVRSQYEYLIGYFVKRNGQAFFESEPQIVKIQKINDKEMQIDYELEFSIVISPDLIGSFKNKRVLLPKYTDSEGLVSFYSKYSPQPCGYDDSHSPTALEGAQRFFYFFRPTTDCGIWKDSAATDVPLNEPILETDGVASPIILSKKQPEYEKVWKDNTFKALLFVANIGTSEEGAYYELPRSDAGLAAINILYRKIRLAYPHATVTIKGKKPNIQGKEPFAPDNWFAQIKWTQGSRKGEVVILYPDDSYLGIVETNQEFMKLYREHSVDADLIAYSGHSSFGDAVQVFSRWTEIRPDHWRMFYVNSCWSAGYLLEGNNEQDNQHLFTRVEEKNPGVPWSRDLDLLLNVGTSNMYKAPANMLALIEHFMESKASYGEILNSLTSEANPLVLGETDNPESH